VNYLYFGKKDSIFRYEKTILQEGLEQEPLISPGELRIRIMETLWTFATLPYQPYSKNEVPFFIEYIIHPIEEGF
jgi:hypothetical protein